MAATAMIRIIKLCSTLESWFPDLDAALSGGKRTECSWVRSQLDATQTSVLTGNPDKAAGLTCVIMYGIRKKFLTTWQSSNKTFKHLLFSFPIFVRTRLPVQRVCLKRKQKSKCHIYIWSRIRPDSQHCIQITKNKKHLIEKLISWKWMRILHTIWKRLIL